MLNSSSLPTGTNLHLTNPIGYALLRRTGRSHAENGTVHNAAGQIAPRTAEMLWTLADIRRGYSKITNISRLVLAETSDGCPARTDVMNMVEVLAASSDT